MGETKDKKEQRKISVLVRIGENWYTPPLFIALAFHNRLKDRNADWRHGTVISPLHSLIIW